jgi:hypothetical protein
MGASFPASTGSTVSTASVEIDATGGGLGGGAASRAGSNQFVSQARQRIFRPLGPIAFSGTS